MGPEQLLGGTGEPTYAERGASLHLGQAARLLPTVGVEGATEEVTPGLSWAQKKDFFQKAILLQL